MTKKKKQIATYGPSGLTEVRLRRLIKENPDVETYFFNAVGAMLDFYDILRECEFTEDDCLLQARRLAMVALGRYMEEDTDYSQYIVETHHDPEWPNPPQEAV